MNEENVDLAWSIDDPTGMYVPSRRGIKAKIQFSF